MTTTDKIYIESIGYINTPDNFFSRIMRENPLYYEALHEPQHVNSFLVSPNRQIWELEISFSGIISEIKHIYSSDNGADNSPATEVSLSAERIIQIGDSISMKEAEENAGEYKSARPRELFQERLNRDVELYLEKKCAYAVLEKAYADFSEKRIGE